MGITKFCVNCGNELDSSDSFCRNCGTMVAKDDSANIDSNASINEEEKQESIEDNPIVPIIDSGDRSGTSGTFAKISEEKKVIEPEVDLNAQIINDDPSVYRPPVANVQTKPSASSYSSNDNKPIDESKEADNKAVILGLVSIGCTVVLPVIFGFIGHLFSSEFLGIDYLEQCCYMLSSMSPVAGLIIMIVGRVMYPKSKFMKILMWVYIALIILSIVATVLLMLFCVVVCGGMLQSCQGMGAFIV